MQRSFAALDGDLAIRLVGRDANVRGPKSPTLQRQHQAIEKIPALKLGFVQLGIDVVMIEQELLAEQLVERAD